MALKKLTPTYERVVCEATRVFARDGFHAARLQDIARAAKIQHPAVLYHFGNKMGLFEACLKKTLLVFGQIIEGNIEPKDDSFTRLNKALDANLAFARTHPEGVSLIVSMYSIATHSPAIRSLYGSVLKDSRARYETWVHGAIREGSFSHSDDPKLISEIIHEFIIGSVVNLLAATECKSEDLKRIRKKWNLLMELWRE